MTRAAAWFAAAVLGLVVVAAMLRPRDDAPSTPTTLGITEVGYGALYDLLAELGLPTARLYESPDRLPAEGTIWWLQPEGVCGGRRQRSGLWDGKAWVEAGGTAVVILSPGRDGCSLGEDLEVPARDLRTVRRRARGVGAPVVGGVLGPTARRLDGPPALSVFSHAGPWTIVAHLDDQPFVLERALGRGRVAIVSEARPFSNRYLDQADSALLAWDLVRRYGVPRFDERAWAPRSLQSPLPYLATSSSAWTFCGLALLATLIVWYGAAVPPRALPPAETRGPGLDAFVDALARLYARTRDHAQVLRRYRMLTLRRLQRHFGLPPEATREAVLARLGGRSDRVAVLSGDGPVTDEQALRAAVRSLDVVAQEVMR